MADRPGPDPWTERDVSGYCGLVDSGRGEQEPELACETGSNTCSIPC